MGKLHQTLRTTPVALRSSAAGTRTTSWRRTETKKAERLRPRAWQREMVTMQKPANKKLMAMIRRAGTPISSIWAEALNIPSSGPARNWKTRKPAVINTEAYKMP